MDRLNKVERELVEGITSIAYDPEVKVQAIINNGVGHIIGIDGGIVNRTTFYNNIPSAEEYLKAFLNMHMFNNNLELALNATKL